MAKDAKGVWCVVIALPAGEHSYKFVVDDNWVADPDNPVTKGEFGNSVVQVAADGKQGASQATANTPYSAKLEFRGRGIGLYEDVPVARAPAATSCGGRRSTSTWSSTSASRRCWRALLMKIDTEQEAPRTTRRA